jgi:hypothetical protein
VRKISWLINDGNNWALLIINNLYEIDTLWLDSQYICNKTRELEL